MDKIMIYMLIVKRTNRRSLSLGIITSSVSASWMRCFASAFAGSYFGGATMKETSSLLR